MANIFYFVAFLATVLLTPMLTNAQGNNLSRYYHLLVGTYTSGKSEGIYVYRFDTETGELTHEYTAKGTENPSFLAMSKDGQYVYSVKEVGGPTGMVKAFRFDKETGAMEFINEQPSGGGGPCYVSLDKDGQHLFVGNYNGGTLSAIPVKEDGSLGEPAQTISHEGSSVNKDRQEKPHVHSTVVSPDNQQVFVGDLGVDKVYIYNYKPADEDSPLQPADQPFIAVKPGSGPRHLIFDESGKYIYLVQELTAEVSVFEKKNGNYSHLQTLGLTEKGFKGEVSAAEVRISPDGKFLYVSNRGDANEIVIFKINNKNGTLSKAGKASSGGKTPRNFIIDPTGNFLLVAHQNSDSIVVFKRDKTTGLITPTGKSIEVGKPVYLKMFPAQ